MHMFPKMVLTDPLYSYTAGRPIPNCYANGHVATNIMADSDLDWTLLQITQKAFLLYLPMFMDIAKNASLEQVFGSFITTPNPYVALASLLDQPVTQLSKMTNSIIFHIQMDVLKQQTAHSRLSKKPMTMPFQGTVDARRTIYPPQGSPVDNLADPAYKFADFIPRCYLIGRHADDLNLCLPLTKQGNVEPIIQCNTSNGYTITTY